MSAHDLLKSAGDLVLSGDPAGVLQVIENAGGVMLTEGGKIALGVLVSRGVDDLLSRLRKAQAEKKIDPDFEKSDRGAALLQAALNALLKGLERERADAVKKIFLAIAKNPVDDTLERIQQIEIMCIAGELTAWEIAFMNALERYSAEVFDKISAEQWKLARDVQQREQIKQAVASGLNLDQWLLSQYCSHDKSRHVSLRKACDSLHNKGIVDSDFATIGRARHEFIVHREGAFTDFGWKLAIYLYSATEGC